MAKEGSPWLILFLCEWSMLLSVLFRNKESRLIFCILLHNIRHCSGLNRILNKKFIEIYNNFLLKVKIFWGKIIQNYSPHSSWFSTSPSSCLMCCITPEISSPFSTSFILFHKLPSCWGWTAEQIYNRWVKIIKSFFLPMVCTSSFLLITCNVWPFKLTGCSPLKLYKDGYLISEKWKPGIQDWLVFVSESNCHFCSVSICYQVRTSSYSVG